MRASLYLRVFVLLCLSPFLSAQNALDSEAIVSRNQGAVLVITGERQDTGARVQGSGCCIHPDGYVLATAHQTQGVERFQGRLSDGSTCTLTLVETDVAGEWALLKADRPLAYVAPGDAGGLRSGAPLLSIASPKSLDFTTVTGIVSNPNRQYRGFPVIQTNLPADHGSSGGPVFDRHGALIGLIILSLGEADWVSAVNPINNAYPLLRKHHLLQRTSAQESDSSQDYQLVPVKGISTKEWRAIEAYNQGVNSGSPQEKQAAYRLAVTLLPDFFEAWFNLAIAQAFLKQDAEAVSSYLEALRIRPDSLAALRNLGRVYMQKQSLRQAAHVFSKALELAPEDAQSYNDLGEVYRQDKQPNLAQKQFMQALKINPAYGAAHFNLALCLANLGENTQAIAHFQSYLHVEPQATDAQQVQAWITELENKIKE